MIALFLPIIFSWVVSSFGQTQVVQPPDQIAIYHYLQKSTGEHFYTADSSEAIQNGFAFQGVGFMLFTQPRAGTIPLYRCFQPGRSHSVSLDPICGGATVEGIYGYLYEKANPNSVPLFRFQSSGKGFSIATQEESEGFAAGMKFDQTLGYVPTLEDGVSNSFQMTDARQSNAFSYAYGPSVISSQGQYHAYFCSTGTGIMDWDNVRHISSSDLVHWSKPAQDVSTGTTVERCNCDPSVVRFDSGDGEYYYDFHSGNELNVQTVIYVARSKTPTGVFSKWTDRGTWEVQPKDPHAIIRPFHSTPDHSGIYGAGQASVVVKGGTLYMWHTDTTENYPAFNGNRIYFRTSTDAVHWTDPVRTNVEQASIDVKYNPITQEFVMVEIVDEHSGSTILAFQTSQDGVTWSPSQTLIDNDHFPHFSNNVGMSGDDQGHLIPNANILISYGAPYDLSSKYGNDCNVFPSPYCWAHWDLYGNLVSASLFQAQAPIQLAPKAAINPNLLKLEVYPNPSVPGQESKFRMTLAQDCTGSEVSLVSVDGKMATEIFSGAVTHEQEWIQSIGVPNLLPGMYLIKAHVFGCGSQHDQSDQQILCWSFIAR